MPICLRCGACCIFQDVPGKPHCKFLKMEGSLATCIVMAAGINPYGRNVGHGHICLGREDWANVSFPGCPYNKESKGV